MSNWNLFHQETARLRNSQPEELYFNARARAKERVNKYGNTKQKTRFYEGVTADEARDQIGEDTPLIKDEKAVLALDILWLVQRKKQGDWSNLLKSLEDALNRVAWPDDRQIYSINGLIKPDQDEHKTLMRIYAT